MKHFLTLISILLLSFAAVCQTAPKPIITNTIVLDGSDSKAEVGTIVKYEWTQTSGPETAIIASPNADTTLITFKDIGLYEFKLTVTDTNGFTGESFAQATVGQYGVPKAYITITKYDILLPPKP